MRTSGGLNYTATYGSNCCGATIDKNMKCSACNYECYEVLVSLLDAFGVPCIHGDIIESFDCETGLPGKHHAVFHERANKVIELEIRDLLHNNVYMWNDGPIWNLGQYWQNLNLVQEEDLMHYWDTNRAEAEEMARRYGK